MNNTLFYESTNRNRRARYNHRNKSNGAGRNNRPTGMTLESQNALHAVWLDTIRAANGGEIPPVPTPTFWEWMQSQ